MMQCAWCNKQVNSLEHLRLHNRQNHWPQKPPASIGVPEDRCTICFSNYPYGKDVHRDCNRPVHCGQPVTSILIWGFSKQFEGNGLKDWRIICSVSGKLATRCDENQHLPAQL